MLKFFRRLFGRKDKKRIKIGLALGSGGAKGFAELGALKAFEENGISFDVIAGTSIGSIVGAFYAEGYSSTDINELLNRLDFGEITSFFMIGMDTMGMRKVIDRELGDKNIEELKKPFRAVATKLETGEERVFSEGNAAVALCASASIPPFFKPVVIAGERYVDGAFSNSIPADVARDLGADYVIGIDLADHDAKPGPLMKIFPTYKSKVKEPWAKGYKYSDVMLHPNMSGFSPTSYRQSSEMYEIGYRHALTFIPKIKADLANLRKKGVKKHGKKD